MLTKEVQLSITLENDSYNPSLFFCGRTVINPLQNLGLDITGMALMNKKSSKFVGLLFAHILCEFIKDLVKVIHR